MASYFYTVLGQQWTRSNQDGSQTVFMHGETVELDHPSDDERLKAVDPKVPGTKLPSPAGFVPNVPSHQVETKRARATEKTAKPMPRK